MHAVDQLKRIKWNQLFIYYLFLQPYLDMVADFRWPISEAIRGLFLILGLIYISRVSKSKQRKLVGGYFILLGFFFTIHLTVNMIVKSPVSMTVELTHVIKTSYFIVMLVVYYYVVHAFSPKLIQKVIIINMVIISIVMVVTTITGTGKRTYEMLAKSGHTGWFFSGNELGVILAIGLSVVGLALLTCKEHKKSVALITLLLVHTLIMLIVGTKVSLFSAVANWAVLFILTVVQTFGNNKAWQKLIPLTLFFVLFLWIIPATPAGQNMNITGFSVNEYEGEEETDLLLEDSNQVNRVLSGRDEFLTETILQYEQAHLSQKLFGMGYGGNYKAEPKLIEMDFIDWRFGFGLIGFILLLTPFIVFVFNLLKQIIHLRMKAIDQTVLMIGLGICLALGSSFVAGHVLSAPAVSIYVALLMAILNSHLNDKVEGECRESS